MNKTYRAKVRDDGLKRHEVLIYATGRWRSFGGPWTPDGKNFRGHFVGYSTAKAAQRGADKLANEFGIKLKWDLS